MTLFFPLILAISAWHLESALAAEVTEGPDAYVSIKSQPAWLSARSCAARCLKYNGDFGCNNAGFYDLGIELGCGCGPSNNCYCSSKFASSVTSYVVKCVSTKCDGIQDWADEATSMLKIYGDYCATANVAISTPGFSFGPTTTADGAAAGSTPTETNPTRATKTGATGAASTSTPTGASGEGAGEKKGLSQSDIVALAASLGVGIPSLLIAIITLVVQMRKKKKRAAESGATPTAAASNVHLIHLHTPTPVVPPLQYHTPPPQYHTPPPGHQYGGYTQQTGGGEQQQQQQFNTTSWSYELDAPKNGNKP